MDRTRLLLVDDHILFREGLCRLLASEPDFEIVGSCGTAGEALELLKQTSVDLVLLDFDLGGGDHGSQFISSARRQGFEGKILMVTAGMSANESSIAIRLGASGIFLKQNSPATLTRAIRMVVGGEAWVDEKVMRLLAAAVDESDQSAAKVLTTREQQVLQAVFEGLTNKEIAAQLCTTESAVKAMLQQLFQKTGVRTRSQLVRIALERSLGNSRKSSS